MSQSNYYSIDNLMNLNTTYAISMGERSRGKTYSALCYGIKMVVESNYKKQFAYLRRFKEDIIVPNCKTLFSSLEANGEIAKLTKGEWNTVEYRAGCWYFAKEGSNGKLIKSKKAFAYAFALRNFEHWKGLSFPNISFVCFDEFISRIGYLSGEWGIFVNALSTIVRDRGPEEVRVVLLGNTVSLEAPYFHTMGIYKKIKEIKVGETLQFKATNSDLTIAVEYTESSESGKSSDVFFDFEDSTSKMITGGSWETADYPLKPKEERILPKHIRYKFYIQMYDEIFEGDVIRTNNRFYLYIHVPMFSVDLDELPKKTLIYSTDYNLDYNYRRDILRPKDKKTTKIADFFKHDEVFYDSNRTGEMIRNYIDLFKTI